MCACASSARPAAGSFAEMHVLYAFIPRREPVSGSATLHLQVAAALHVGSSQAVMSVCVCVCVWCECVCARVRVCTQIQSCVCSLARRLQTTAGLVIRC